MISLGYPDSPTNENKMHMKNFILSIPTLLPCDGCKIFSKSYIYSVPERVDNAILSRNNLVEFFITFHNAVNEKLGKKLWTGDITQLATEKYKKQGNDKYMLIAITIAFITVMFIMMRK